MGILNTMAEYTRLALELSNLSHNAETSEAYEPIERRRTEIIKRISELKEIERMEQT